MNFNRSKISKAVTTVMLSAASMAIANTAIAQEVTEDDVEVIQVRGLISSIARSLATKQDAQGFVDAINAEDVGKLPDTNVAEALQRVTGVTIQRSRGEGDFVSLRGLGPDFVKGNVNGRSLLNSTETVDPIFNGNAITSTGRAANFDILPSEVITNLDVVKSPSASTIEGGMAGSVNVQTARPLTMGHKVSGSFTGTYREFNEEFDPSATGLVSWVNNDKSFGFLGAVSYSQRTLREDFSRTFGWFPVAAGIDSQLDTNNDGTGDTNPADVAFSLSNNAEAYQEDRERFTVTSTLQWRGDDSDLSVDFLYSKRDVQENHQNFIFLPYVFEGADVSTYNDDGSLQFGNNEVTNGALTRAVTSIRPEATTDMQDYEDDLLMLGANYQFSTENWEFETDLSYSKAEGKNYFDRVRIDANNGAFAFDTQIGQDGFNITQTNLSAGASADLGNPANYEISVFDDRLASNKDEETAFQFDAERAIESDVISSIEMGVRLRSREKSIARGSNGNGVGVTGAGITLADVGAFVPGASDFLDGTWQTNFGFDSLVFPDNAAARSALSSYMSENGISTSVSNDPFGSFDVEEDTYATYFQANLDGEVGDLPFSGNVGLRVVLTKQYVDGNDAEFVIFDRGGQDTTVFDELQAGSATPVSFEDSYASVLPSVNFRLELDEDLYLRFAANESLTRPTFNALAPSYGVNANGSFDRNGDNFAVDLAAGNPALKPYESTNFDLGLEWYFGEASALYAAVFHKDLENIIATTQYELTSELAGQPIRAIGVQMDGSRGGIPVDSIRQPDNSGTGEITGLELGLQQSYESGFGYIANVTLVDSSAEYADTGVDIDFTGVSSLSYNLTGFYEQGPLQLRLAYNYRNEYLVEPNAIGFGGQLFNDDYSQLDATASYDINENLTVVVNGVNLTDEDQDVYSQIPGIGRQFLSTSHVGPRVSVGVRGSF